jgi:hypothetical protein
MAHFFAVGLYVLDKYEAYTFNKKNRHWYFAKYTGCLFLWKLFMNIACPRNIVQ